MTIAQSLEHSWIKVRLVGLLPLKDGRCDKPSVCREGLRGSGPGQGDTGYTLRRHWHCRPDTLSGSLALCACRGLPLGQGW